MKKPKLKRNNNKPLNERNDIEAEITGTSSQEVIRVEAWDGCIELTLIEAIALKKFLEEAIPYIQLRQKKGSFFETTP